MIIKPHLPISFFTWSRNFRPPPKKLLVWRNEGLDNFFFKCVYCIYCKKCLCSCTIKLNKTKKQQHNFIPLSCAPFQCFIMLIYQNEVKVWHIFGEIEYRNSLLFQEKPSETFLEDFNKKGTGSDQILGSAGYAKPTFFLKPNLL